MARAFIFNPGPAILPLPVLEEAARNLVDFQGVGMSILEMSHRSKDFEGVIQGAETGIRKLLGVPEGYSILFLQGGASLQFAMVPMNLLPAGKVADYIDTGGFAKKAIDDGKKLGSVNVAASTKAENYRRLPRPDEIALTPGAAYVHITSNNTIEGTQWKDFPETADVPLAADMSSDFLSRPFDVRRFGVIYAGAQKNAGPAGVTIVIVRNDLAEAAPAGLPAMLDYRSHIKGKSLYNTPPCFSIYLVHLVARWMEELGGIAEMEKRNRKKAKLLYDRIDASDFYTGTCDEACRSLMNVTFRLPKPELEEAFVKEAKGKGLVGLKGHRSVGGIRASIYNAFPIEGIERLVAFMDEFEKKNR
ncbi:MAG: 3-phosphoserine/phosphohydroxythreonine transaminase [Planctomycetes bacterium]|nr:3-phosphoserine/phosphohydroxythreonine transaminase [Planctomycetota bacterium]